MKNYYENYYCYHQYYYMYNLDIYLVEYYNGEIQENEEWYLTEYL